MAPRYIRLLSSDGFEFVITREAAEVSGTLRNMLNSEQFDEAQTGRVELDMEAYLLKKVCEYFYFNLAYRKDAASDFDIPPAMALELLVAADFLDT